MIIEKELHEGREQMSTRKVKLNVQTMYRGELLRAGKVYEVSNVTAKRWIQSKLASEVTYERSNEETSS